MKRTIFRLFLLCSYSLTATAQQQIQGGFYVGGINYEGDLAPSNAVVSFTNTHLDVGAFLHVKPSKILSFKVNYHHGNLTGSDENSNDVARQNRHLHFRTALDELSVSGEIFFLNWLKKPVFRPFLAVGIGAFHFNPQAEYKGVWYDLQPLSTEGQGLGKYSTTKPYSLTQVCFPIGTGFQWSISRRIQVEFEVSMRKTRTDYLDDVSTHYVPLEWLSSQKGAVAAALSNRSLAVGASLRSENLGQRGLSHNKDWYVIGAVGLTINIWGENKQDNLFKKKKKAINYINCPRILKNKKRH